MPCVARMMVRLLGPFGLQNEAAIVKVSVSFFMPTTGLGMFAPARVVAAVKKSCRA